MKLRFTNTKNSAEKWARKSPQSKGGVIGFVTLTELLVLLPEVIFLLPMMILLYCHTLNEENIRMGDPTGLPESYNWYLIGAGIVALLFIICVQAWIILSARYAWKRVPKKTKTTTETQK